jgi:transcriptional regulator with XRE-family HTH domain
MVTFRNWIQQSGMTQEVIARRLGVSRSYVTQLAQGKRTPSLKVVRNILLIANGSLTAEDLLLEFTQ